MPTPPHHPAAQTQS
ncbi:hypothetical protein VN97_g11130, partial [Penicillium thymicola]